MQATNTHSSQTNLVNQMQNTSIADQETSNQVGLNAILLTQLESQPRTSIGSSLPCDTHEHDVAFYTPRQSQENFITVTIDESPTVSHTEHLNHLTQKVASPANLNHLSTDTNEDDSQNHPTGIND
jgi:hypothetical protein